MTTRDPEGQPGPRVGAGVDVPDGAELSDVADVSDVPDVTDVLDVPDVMDQAARWLAAGRKVALATVVRTWGSSPRPAGSQLAVNDAGAFVGSVSGGCIEGAVVGEALAVMAGGPPRLLEFGVTSERAWEVGLACGGQVQVFVEAIE